MASLIIELVTGGVVAGILAGIACSIVNYVHSIPPVANRLDEWATTLHGWNHPEETDTHTVIQFDTELVKEADYEPGWLTRSDGTLELREISLVSRPLHPSWHVNCRSIVEPPVDQPANSVALMVVTDEYLRMKPARHNRGTDVWELPGIQQFHTYRAGASHRAIPSEPWGHYLARLLGGHRNLRGTT